MHAFLVAAITTAAVLANVVLVLKLPAPPDEDGQRQHQDDPARTDCQLAA